jgi:alkyl hydroperoxide reductase subunit AhpC
MPSLPLLRERRTNSPGKASRLSRYRWATGEKSEALVEKYKLVAYGADARAVSAATGAFVNDDPVCLQATGFVLNPEGRIVTAVYSTRAIGRLLPDDVLGFVRYLKCSAKN